MAKEFYARKAMHKGIEVVELAAEGYYAIVAPSIGSNVLRFRDTKKKMEIFRYSDEVTIAEIMNSPEIWGLPTLYIANRLDNGVLKTSDAEYRFPMNEEKLKNHIHGFIQRCVHKVKAIEAKDGKAYVTTTYTHDEGSFFYNCFPLKFTVEITIELSKDGLRHTFSITNKSKKMLPVSVATHTTIKTPFVDGGKQENVRFQLPAVKKIQFNKRRWLPNGRFLPLNDYDMQYVDGTMCPVLKDINNNMYTAGTIRLGKKDFHGCIVTDTESGKKIFYEVDDKYRFWIIWNHKGFNNYFCPEPMTAQVNAPNLDIPREKSGYDEIAPKETYTVSQRFFTK